MSTTRVDIEDLTSTKSEKFLAVILTAFILIGAGWAYVKTDDLTGVADRLAYTASQQAIVTAQADANQRLWDANDRVSDARDQLNSARDDLNLAINQNAPTEDAQLRYDTAKAELAKIETLRNSAKTKSDAADAAVKKLEQSRDAEAAQSQWRAWLSAGLRLALISAMTFVGLQVMRRMRERESRYLPLSFALIAAGVIMALVFATHYIARYINFLELGPIVLSVLGTAATVAAFAGLQRYLARRIPRARVRKGECPFCAFPVTLDEGEHCAGCGRDVVGTCANCQQRRRVGTPHCPHCGAA